MIKLFSKDTIALLAIGEIPGKYFAADLEGTDMLGIVSDHPLLFWSSLIVLGAVCVGYGIYRFIRKKEVS